MCIKCLIVLLLLFLPYGLGSGKYCDLPACGENNLACDNKGQINSKCVPNTRIVPMTVYRNSLLSVFNDFRNSVARGDRRLKPAARMAKMSWSTELEHMAKLSAISCSMDKFCLSTENFYYVGSIFDAFKYPGRVYEYEDYEIILYLISGWTNRLADISLGMVIYMPDYVADMKILNAALLISEANTHVGCTAMRFTFASFHHFVLVCAFSTDVFINRSLYKLSASPGSACKRRDSTYPALCAAGERYHNERPLANATLLQPPGGNAMIQRNPDLATFYNYNLYNYG
ncbi:allergen Tab y 5.0101-like [Drosophila subobscura]|uniref:allergen Tab y 5.0101-like n=1 Tax=Drosophila subobscura TaxID=7241 RepID=UPI00155AEF5F|nr:allergen Tab y 5.0101-like [Drosophila subobscura]